MAIGYLNIVCLMSCWMSAGVSFILQQSTMYLRSFSGMAVCYFQMSWRVFHVPL